MPPAVTYTVELATASGANPATWTDVSAYVRKIAFRQGRDDWLAQVQPGTAVVTFKNDDGRFSPSLTTSPLYPHVTEMRAMRITGTIGVTTYNLYRGFIDSIRPNPNKNVRTCTISLIDGSVWLSLATTTPTYTNVASGTSVGVALTSASWPAGLRSLDTGQSTFTPAYTDTDVLSQVQGIAADNEAGLFYFDGRGYAVFEDRHHRLKGAHLTSQATFNATMHDLIPERPARDIANEIKVTYTGGGSVTRSDSTSQTAYGPRRLEIAASFLSAADATSRAEWTLAERKDPHERPVLVLRGESTTILTHCLNLGISDRITVQETTNTGLNSDYFIESRELAIEVDGWTVATWQLSRASTVDLWILDVSTSPNQVAW